MGSFARHIIINDTPERLFDYVTDQDNLPKWSHQVLKSEVKGGGPVIKGTILLQERKQGSRTMQSVVEVIRHDRPTVHAVRTLVMGVEATFIFTFEQQGTGTKVTMEGIVEGRGLGRLLAPMLKRMMEKADDQVLENLQAAIQRA